MNIRVNGIDCDVKASDLEGLLAELDYADQTVATALNRNFVRKKDRAEAKLNDGDEVEILTPRQGG
ncbi:MAG: sulfur carrier protein ThiS [Hyphomicrobiales bacterium]|nr:sulfur carrier protein ThiS [Rhodoblastus sp.]MCB9998228.1 sulfur carrier protein ThiS [Methylobacteriaceae bacterium]MCC2101384.1 sulfur carrier protein ThiS [Hyphomicrobiales bacterium]MCC2105577.1 sulfur carrier protein ThiS [Hyphomicrobiales bacterium]MCC2106547.1 sulfur carrier protein ThiS [Hyphomicrobiales bacterium]